MTTGWASADEAATQSTVKKSREYSDRSMRTPPDKQLDVFLRRAVTLDERVGVTLPFVLALALRRQADELVEFVEGEQAREVLGRRSGAPDRREQLTQRIRHRVRRRD